MANSCPVIATDIPVFQEIAPGGFFSYEAGNHANLAEKMIEVIENQEAVESMIVQGLETARHYTWERTYQGFSQVYRKLINESTT
jgi:glycosyltransferase involved in cell wall biosynthesis